MPLHTLDLALARLRARLQQQDGIGEVAQTVAIGAFSVAVIAVIWGALQMAGVDIVNWVRDTIIGGGQATTGAPGPAPSP